MGETMTQKTQEAIKFAQHWLELAGKHGDPNAPTTVCIVDLAKAVVELNTELTALKERYRWRKQNKEPAPAGQELEIYSTIQERVFSAMPTKGLSSSWYWRPLDLPEEGAE